TAPGTAPVCFSLCTPSTLPTQRRTVRSCRLGETSAGSRRSSGGSCRARTSGLSSSMLPSTTPTAVGTPSPSTGPSVRSLAMARAAWAGSLTGNHRFTAQNKCRSLPLSRTRRLPGQTWLRSTRPSGAWTKGSGWCCRSCATLAS
uniref:N-sulphoglucosamine sulphohydrolase-like n=1 Tax=Cyanistes caeruleus TaxID=156563 RepID=A0A8C0TVG5_CYACU